MANVLSLSPGRCCAMFISMPVRFSLGSKEAHRQTTDNTKAKGPVFRLGLLFCLLWVRSNEPESGPGDRPPIPAAVKAFSRTANTSQSPSILPAPTCLDLNKALFVSCLHSHADKQRVSASFSRIKGKRKDAPHQNGGAKGLSVNNLREKCAGTF